MVTAASGEVKVLVICGQSAPVDAWKRAYERAKSEGVRVFHLDGTWLATSVSKPGERHTVNGRCDCQGAARGLVCKHVAAVRSAQLLRGELRQCAYCGEVGPVEHMSPEWRHVGGQSDRLECYCGPGFGHQAGHRASQAA